MRNNGRHLLAGKAAFTTTQRRRTLDLLYLHFSACFLQLLKFSREQNKNSSACSTVSGTKGVGRAVVGLEVGNRVGDFEGRAVLGLDVGNCVGDFVGRPVVGFVDGYPVEGRPVGMEVVGLNVDGCAVVGGVGANV